MTAILTVAEMRALEQAAIAQGEVTGLELMERAGRGVVEAILAEWPKTPTGHRATVLCGPGNNGGDGFVVARLLEEQGWRVEVLAMAGPEALPPDAATAASRWLRGGRKVKPPGEFRGPPAQADVIVDALFGTGLSRPIEGEAGELVRHLAGSGGDRAWFRERVVSIDVPSGLNADTGFVPGYPEPGPFGCGAPNARLTVTFDSPKAGHYLAHGPELCGRLVVADIGLGHLRRSWVSDPDPEQRTRRGIRLPRLALVEPTPDGIGGLTPGAFRVRDVGKSMGHKYAHGHAVLLSGGCGRGGAARMSARGCLRIGAGLVTLAVPPAALQENAARVDAIMLRSIKDADALAEYLQDDRLNALCAGPGLGTGEAQGQLLARVLDLRRPTVLDADALTLVAKDEVLRGKLHDRVVLTPHDGEFARLVPEIAGRLMPPRRPIPSDPSASVSDRLRQSHSDSARFSEAVRTWQEAPFSKVDAVREAARSFGCTVLLKGPNTVIADPTGRAAISAAVYDRAAPWLATAGSGDVLAGFIAGLLARGFQPFDAACTAAWLHVECARSFGPGLIAEDLPEELPKVFRGLAL